MFKPLIGYISLNVRLSTLHGCSLYPALETLTEPHRLQATLAGTVGVARAMMIHPDRYPEGRLHVIPILQLCLPGIDSNDCHKTIVSAPWGAVSSC